ncbi:MAG: twin-arginine translocase TatA/TatE family subunit [Bacteroidetes bacterium]|nr:twin-arginine translocase TatA/TatE family subunit [Bacteroidota bacterium]
MVILGVIGPWQIIIIVVLILLLFGGKKIPELMRGLGKGAREFKKGLSEEDDEKSPPKEEPRKENG